MQNFENVPLTELYDLLSEKTKELLDAIHRKDNGGIQSLKDELKGIQEMIKVKRGQQDTDQPTT